MSGTPVPGTLSLPTGAGVNTPATVSAAINAQLVQRLSTSAALSDLTNPRVALTNLGGLPITGGTLGGPLILSGPPTQSLQAATKAYVDASAGAVSSVVGQTGAITVLQLSTALAGTNLTVDATTGKLDAQAGGGSSTVPVTTESGTGTYNLTFASSGDKAYDISMTGQVTIAVSGGTVGQMQKISVQLRQPTTTGGYSVTLPPYGSGAGYVRWDGGVVPSVNTAQNTITFLQFITMDGGVTVIGQ